MSISPAQAASHVSQILAEVEGERTSHLRIKDYLDGNHDAIYTYRGTSREYRTLLKNSILNLCPIIVATGAQRLYVDGYRSTDSLDNSPIWDIWQANRLDARQAQIYQSVIAYGVAYATVLPGTPYPVINPKTALQMHALFDDETDDYPVFAVERLRNGRVKLYDDTAIYLLAYDADSESFNHVKTLEHDLGYTPVVMFRNSFDATGRIVGDVERLIPQFNTLNQTQFSIALGQELGAHRQKYLLGYETPTDADGNPLQGDDLQASISRLWTFSDPNMKVGEFDQTDLTGSLENRKEIIRNIAVTANVPVHLLGDMINVGAEVAATVETAQTRAAVARQSLLGESWELVLETAALQAGLSDEVDLGAQVVWRDTSTRSLSQTVDALGKMVALLDVPAEKIWRLLPGITQGDINDFLEGRENDEISQLVNALQSGPVEPLAIEPAAPAVERSPQDLKAIYDALGAGIRAGVDPQDVAESLGIDVAFTGATPVSLRLPESTASDMEAR